MLVEQLDAYNQAGLHISRPNTQNDVGNILSDMGLSRLCDDIVVDVLQPLGAKEDPFPQVRRRVLDRYRLPNRSWRICP